MSNIGLPQLLLIALIAALIFGASRLPELGRWLGRSVARTRRAALAAHEDPKLGGEPSGTSESRRRRGLAA